MRWITTQGIASFALLYRMLQVPIHVAYIDKLVCALGEVVGLELETCEGEGFLRINVSGELPLRIPEAIDAYAQISVVASTSGHSRFLLDVRAARNRMSIPAIFEYITLAYPDKPDHSRTAVIELPEHFVGARFFENLAQSRGRIFRLFKAEDEALEWLLSENS